MIPNAHITAWRADAPWALDQQVEQDLVISRAIAEIFDDSLLGRELAFRGGTALNKLYFKPAYRYSEDIDLVQVRAGPIGPILRAMRGRLDSWLGEPSSEINQASAKLRYRFDSTALPVTRMRLKIEINTREHFAVRGLVQVPFEVKSSWWSGTALVTTYCLEELLGTKMRALYQRRKGRDLFDLVKALGLKPPPNLVLVVRCFEEYMEKAQQQVSKIEFERNLRAKVLREDFLGDIDALLPSRVRGISAEEALELVQQQFLDKLTR